MAIKKKRVVFFFPFFLTFNFLLPCKSLSQDRRSAWHRKRAEKCTERIRQMLRLERRPGSEGRGGADKDIMKVFRTQLMKERLRSLDTIDKEGVVYGGW